VFMNRNIGKYFLGKYPQNVPEYYNGFFEYHLNSADLNPVSGRIRVEETEDGIIIANDLHKEGSVEVDFESPFPFVGGAYPVPSGLKEAQNCCSQIGQTI